MRKTLPATVVNLDLDVLEKLVLDGGLLECNEIAKMAVVHRSIICFREINRNAHARDPLVDTAFNLSVC